MGKRDVHEGAPHDGRDRLIRPEDALDMLRDALRAPPKSKERKALLDGALFTYYLGLINYSRRGDRRGRPTGTTGVRHKRHKGDDDALRLMKEIAVISGESKPYALARKAVESGHVGMHGKLRETVIKRLAARWKQSTEK
jgi:hypothetical protein